MGENKQIKLKNVTLVMGIQWGDEGKGKIVDYLAGGADIIARSVGGNNAGHTVVVGQTKYKFHLLPSGVIHRDKLSICGNGMVIYPPQIIKEIKNLEKGGIKLTNKNLIISSAAHVITEEHIKIDQEKGARIGTTGKGIGPCYESKIARNGKRMIDFIKEESEEAKKLGPFVADTYTVLRNAVKGNKTILVEGAQGSMLDIDHGTYPFVTSSNSTAGGVCTGLGIGPTKINEVIGVLKAYTTRVGRGPFPTELGAEEEAEAEGKEDELDKDDIQKANQGEEYYAGKVLRKRGVEYGTTTGRPRRTGWLDLVVGRYAAWLNGLTSLVITKLDCLSDFEKIKICVAYEIDGERIDDFPVDPDKLSKVKPIYEELDGWQKDISEVREYGNLPENTKKYLERIEEAMETPISIISVGPERTQTILK